MAGSSGRPDLQSVGLAAEAKKVHPGGTRVPKLLAKRLTSQPTWQGFPPPYVAHPWTTVDCLNTGDLLMYCHCRFVTFPFPSPRLPPAWFASRLPMQRKAESFSTRWLHAADDFWLNPRSCIPARSVKE